MGAAFRAGGCTSSLGTCGSRRASGIDARASSRRGASEDVWSWGGHFLSGGLGSLGVVMGIIRMTLPKTVMSPRCLPGAVLVASHTLCVAHLLAAKVEGRVQGPVPPLHVREWVGAAPPLPHDLVLRPQLWVAGLGRAGQWPGGLCPAGPRALWPFPGWAASGPSKSASPAWTALGWAQVATSLGSAQPGQPSVGL